MDYKDLLVEIDTQLFAIRVSGDDVLRMAKARQLMRELLDQLTAEQQQ